MFRQGGNRFLHSVPAPGSSAKSDNRLANFTSLQRRLNAVTPARSDWTSTALALRLKTAFRQVGSSKIVRVLIFLLHPGELDVQAPGLGRGINAGVVLTRVQPILSAGGQFVEAMKLAQPLTG